MDSFLTWKEERNEKVYSLLPSSHRIIRGKLFTVLVDKIIRTTTAEWMGQSYNLQLACPKHCHGGGRAATEHHHHHHHSMDTLLLTSATWCVKKKLINWSGRFYASSAAHWFSELHVNVLAFLINCHSSHNVAWKLKKKYIVSSLVSLLVEEHRVVTWAIGVSQRFSLAWRPICQGWCGKSCSSWQKDPFSPDG